MQIEKIENKVNLFTEFSFLNKDTNDQFLAQKATFLTYPDKEILCNGSKNDEESLNIIYYGTVKVIRPVLNSNQVISYCLETGCLFGLEKIISNNNVLPMIVSAVGKVEIYRIHKNDILEQCKDANVLKGLFQKYITTMNYAIMPSY
ncbi:MAG: hypothetical protein ACJARD_000911 [Alphaproteobacteria bacterium]|jgi:hypothetical protein